jgi:DNA-binding transcriptional ArsR family regulator
MSTKPAPDTKRTQKITDPRVLRALAHPTRLRLYEVLVSGGPQTVSLLARQLGGMVGTLSYHLRELQKYGFIEESPESARDGRERWWRAVPGGMRWSNDEMMRTAGGRQAVRALTQVAVGRQVERLFAWHEQFGQWSAAWQAAAFSTDTLLRMTPAELDEMGTELDELLQRWSSRGRNADSSTAASPAGDDEPRREVFIAVHAFPMPIDGGP